MTHYVQSALLLTSLISRLDPRLLLATMMEASKGKASTPCACLADGGQCVCGIMQVPHSRSFDEDNAEKSVDRMILAGLEALMDAMKAEGLTSDDLLLAVESRVGDGVRSFGKVMGQRVGKDNMLGNFEVDLANWLMGLGLGKDSLAAPEEGPNIFVVRVVSRAEEIPTERTAPHARALAKFMGVVNVNEFSNLQQSERRVRR